MYENPLSFFPSTWNVWMHEWMEMELQRLLSKKSNGEDHKSWPPAGHVILILSDIYPVICLYWLLQTNGWIQYKDHVWDISKNRWSSTKEM